MDIDRVLQAKQLEIAINIYKIVMLCRKHGTSSQILHSGGLLANAFTCFSAAITGKIIHPLELETIIKKEHAHDE
jgi:hypothetical protein